MEMNERLKCDLESPEFQHGVQQEFWRLRACKEDVVYIDLIAPDARVFTAELDCKQYWVEPIRCRFVDPLTFSPTADGPAGNETFAGWVKAGPDQFICWPQDRQAITHHPEWRALKQWQSDPNQILGYLCILQKLLYVPGNGYKHKCH